ncbi:MAG: hypothetical protein DHS20C15_27490 [Planctomycetota bacterium]|nr:MAG: hypothetical protein DHS20C15_27490 [Planctomycetota bacterium]
MIRNRATTLGGARSLFCRIGVREAITKKSKAKPVLDQALTGFGSELASLKYDAFAAWSLYQHQYRAAESATRKGKHRETMVAIVARDLGDPKFGKLALSADRAGKGAWLRRNRESFNRLILGLFTLSFEAFERFTKDLYACLGYLDRRCWRAQDFGSLCLADIPGKNLPWFKSTVRNNKSLRSAHDVRKQLGRVFPELSSPSCSEWNSWLTVIEMLRHWCVHQQGSVHISEYRQVLCKRTGLDAKHELLQRSERLLLGRRGQCQVWLVSKGRIAKSSFDATRAFTELQEHLGNMAAYYYRLSMGRFGHKPKWVG